MQDYLKTWSDKAIEYAPDVLLAILFLIVGLIVIKTIGRALKKGLDRKQADPSLSNFLVSLTGILLKVLLVLAVIRMVGFETTSFVAVLAAAGFAIGMALQGSLANFAGGVLILLFKPFRTGDLIEAQGFLGTVNKIDIFNTVLKTPDNRTIILPNGSLSNGAITNINMEENRRVDMTFGIGYDDDIKKAKETLAEIVKADARILDDPAPVIAVAELADSSVNFAVKVWGKREDYWGIYLDMQERVKLTFDEKGISIPFPQSDVHMIK